MLYATINVTYKLLFIEGTEFLTYKLTKIRCIFKGLGNKVAPQKVSMWQNEEDPKVGGSYEEK